MECRTNMPAVDAIFGMDVFSHVFPIFSLNEDSVPSACRVLAFFMSAGFFFFPSLEPELYVHMPLALKPKPRQFMMSGNEEGAEQKELMELFMGPNFTKVTGASGWEDFLTPTIQDVDPNYIRRFVSFLLGEVPHRDGLGTLSCSLSCFTAVGHFGRSSTELKLYEAMLSDTLCM